MAIHDNLKQLRSACGMTQEQVAEKLHLTRQAVSNYEAGRTRPDIDTLMQLAEIYQTDLDGIIYGQHRQLLARHKLQKAAHLLLLITIVLTLASSLFLCCANHFFAIAGSQLSAGEYSIFQVHQKLMQAWETTDLLIICFSTCGFILLLFLQINSKLRISRQEKLRYVLIFAGSICLIAIVISLFDTRFSTVDYLITPLLVNVRLTLFFGISIVADIWQKQK